MVLQLLCCCSLLSWRLRRRLKWRRRQHKLLQQHFALFNAASADRCPSSMNLWFELFVHGACISISLSPSLSVWISYNAVKGRSSLYGGLGCLYIVRAVRSLVYKELEWCVINFTMWNRLLMHDHNTLFDTNVAYFVSIKVCPITSSGVTDRCRCRCMHQVTDCNGTVTYKPRRLPRHQRAQAHNSTPNSRQKIFM
jgi:hypothetical protein